MGTQGTNIALPPETLVICGTPFHNVTYGETIDWCLSRIRAKKPALVITANLDHLLKAQQDPEYQHLEGPWINGKDPAV